MRRTERKNNLDFRFLRREFLKGPRLRLARQLEREDTIAGLFRRFLKRTPDGAGFFYIEEQREFFEALGEYRLGGGSGGYGPSLHSGELERNSWMGIQ